MNIAQILVFKDYCDSTLGNSTSLKVSGIYYPQDKIDPFANTLEGRKQLDVIKNYMRSSVYLRNLWQRSMMPFDFMYEDCYECDKKRIRWCLEELKECDI